jgi:uncharacterized protein (TIGR02599 family)
LENKIFTKSVFFFLFRKKVKNSLKNSGFESAFFSPAFSLLELLVSMTVLALILVLMTSIVSSTSSIWRSTSAKIQSFQGARAALDSISRTVSQATLAPYWDYFDKNGAKTPLWDASQPYASVNPTAQYGRFSDFHFVCGSGKTLTDVDSNSHAIFFQAPLGYSTNVSSQNLKGVLNSAGYFIEYGSDAEWLPNIEALKKNAKSRYRLMEMLQPSELMNVYQNSSSVDPAYWIKDNNLLLKNRRILAENIIAMIIHPKLSTGDKNTSLTGVGASYFYNSRDGQLADPKRHQLPPMLGLTLVAIDEDSAARLDREGVLKSTIESALNGKFNSPGIDADGFPQKLSEDLSDLKSFLDEKRIGYRIFSTDIGIRAAKWSDK